MTAPREGGAAPADGLLDLMVLPEASAPAPADGTTSPQPAGWRMVGALLFWGVFQGAALLPRDLHVLAGQYHPLLPPALGLLVTLALAAGFVWRFALRGGPEAAYRRDTFRLRPMPAAVARRLPLVALPLMVTVAASLVLVPRIIPIPKQHDELLEAYMKLPFGLVSVLALVAVLAPLLEEFLFRGWIQRRLERRFPGMRAVLLTALIFSAAHAELFGLPIRFLFGVVVGYLAWQTRSIWPGVVLHGFYNATLFAGSGGPSVDEGDLARWAHTPSIFWPTALVFVLASLILVAALRTVAAAAAESGGRSDEGERES